jgi:hypothetical protein
MQTQIKLRFQNALSPLVKSELLKIISHWMERNPHDFVADSPLYGEVWEFSKSQELLNISEKLMVRDFFIFLENFKSLNIFMLGNSIAQQNFSFP